MQENCVVLDEVSWQEGMIMLLSPGNILGAIFEGLSMGILLKIIIAAPVAFISMKLLVDPKPDNKKTLYATGVIAVVGSLAFQVPMWIISGIIGLVGGIVAFWLVVTFTLDYFCDINYDQSYTYTAEIVIISVLFWLIIGVVFFILGEVSRPGTL
mgnify:FL=1